jgi:hypothetical protein
VAGAETGTLAARVGDRDRQRFVGRTAELSFLERCLGENPPASVVLIHGPGGIGKSTLLRELARRAEAYDRAAFMVEGREIPPVPDALEALLAGARHHKRPLVLIDTYERMAALDGYLRRGLLPSLTDQAVVVIAGRRPPSAAWFAGGWEGIAVELELGTMATADAIELLAAHGLSDGRAPGVADWAAGSPLALTLAAQTAAADTSWSPERSVHRPELVASLMRRLVDTELRGLRLSAVSVAAISLVTTVELLRAVLPDADAETAYAQLEALSFTESLGDGLTLHDLVRKALHADLRLRDPDRERELRRRIIDHLYEQGRRGDLLLAIDMAHLIENPVIRWGYGWEGSSEYRIDGVRPGDAEQVSELLRERGLAPWWGLTRRFFEDSPERVAIARDIDDRLSGYLVCMTTSTAPECAHEDPLLGPWLAHAAEDARYGDSVLWHDSVDFTPDRSGRLQGMLGMAGILRSGASNPRFAYMPINTGFESALAFARMVGATHIAGLDLEFGGRQIQCHRIDYGPGGLLAATRGAVYVELGLPPPVEPAGADRVGIEEIREALRNFRIPRELARHPLATGDTPEQRAESVRAVLADAAEHAFGDTENEKLLRRVLIRGYLKPATSHEQAALDLSLSRAAYFRRLRVAAERVAEYIAERS